jgi:hypothetical protein
MDLCMHGRTRMLMVHSGLNPTLHPHPRVQANGQCCEDNPDALTHHEVLLPGMHQLWMSHLIVIIMRWASTHDFWFWTMQCLRAQCIGFCRCFCP